MRITNKVIDYVKNSMQFCNSNVIITDLNKVKMTEILLKDQEKIVTNDKLHSEILNIITEWQKNLNGKGNLFNIVNGKCFKLFENDNNSYFAQMIFPLCDNNELIGLIIFFRTDSGYVASSIKSVSSCIEFINKFILEGD